MTRNEEKALRAMAKTVCMALSVRRCLLQKPPDVMGALDTIERYLKSQPKPRSPEAEGLLEELTNAKKAQAYEKSTSTSTEESTGKNSVEPVAKPHYKPCQKY